MKLTRLNVFCTAIALAAVLIGCGAEATVIEIETSQNYDDQSPFVNEKLIYISEDIDSLKLDVSFEMKGKSGDLEIVNRETQETEAAMSFDEDVEKHSFGFLLENLKKDSEYVVRFTGEEITYAKVAITAKNKLVKELERPLKPMKE